jgi:hypothetical protein
MGLGRLVVAALLVIVRDAYVCNVLTDSQVAIPDDASS